MTQEEVNKWEQENWDKIRGWEADWDTKPGYKLVTFFFKDKTEYRFQIEL